MRPLIAPLKTNSKGIIWAENPQTSLTRETIVNERNERLRKAMSLNKEGGPTISEVRKNQPMTTCHRGRVREGERRHIQTSGTQKEDRIKTKIYTKNSFHQNGKKQWKYEYSREGKVMRHLRRKKSTRNEGGVVNFRSRHKQITKNETNRAGKQNVLSNGSCSSLTNPD